jgi:S-formylglutathione hydrolase
MRFGVYLPPQAESERVPVLTYRAGLTCNEETFASRRCPAPRARARHRAGDTGHSPRGTDFPGQADNWDFGIGAGFYVDATAQPWAKHWRMYSYINHELPEVVANAFGRSGTQSIFGHSMGGHALWSGAAQSERYRSVSAFARSARRRSALGQQGVQRLSRRGQSVVARL